MRTVRVEMLYRLRCPDCASAYRNLGRAVWRLRRSVEVHVGLLPAPIPREPMHDIDFNVHCLIQRAQGVGRQHALMQLLMDSAADRARRTSSRQDVRHLAAQVAIEPAGVPLITAAESAAAVRHALERVAELDPVRAPAFLIDDEHLLHGNASPAFIHDVLQTLAEPRTTTARNPSMGLSKWTSWTTSSIP